MNSEYKLPELERIENEMDELAREYFALHDAVSKGEINATGERMVRLTQIFDRGQILAKQITGERANQKTYSALVDAANQIITKSALSAHAEILMKRLDAMHRDYGRMLKQWISDDGMKQVENNRRHALNAGIPQDVVNRVYERAASDSRDAKQAVRDEIESPV